MDGFFKLDIGQIIVALTFVVTVVTAYSGFTAEYRAQMKMLMKIIDRHEEMLVAHDERLRVQAERLARCVATGEVS